MNFAEETDAIRRLKILQLIIQEGGRSNDEGLLTALRMIGHTQYMDMAAVRRLLRELGERDCVSIGMYRDTIMVADITERGRMAAAGNLSVGGIASPHAGL